MCCREKSRARAGPVKDLQCVVLYTTLLRDKANNPSQNAKFETHLQYSTYMVHQVSCLVGLLFVLILPTFCRLNLWGPIRHRQCYPRSFFVRAHQSI
jgi:hypothetical protein